MVRRMEKVQAKNRRTVRQMQQFGRRGNLAIACKRPQYDHHLGQKYRDLSIQNLASGGWKHAKSKSDYFTIIATKSVLLGLQVLSFFFCLTLNVSCLIKIDRSADFLPE